ncbi:MAG: S1C family serine protease [Planctomycetota bacterium]
MRPWLACALAATAALARAQDLDRDERVRRAVVRVEAVDRSLLKAREMIAVNAPVEELRKITIRQPYVLCTAGVVISPDGEIVTPALHPNAPLDVTVTFFDGTRSPAELVGTDPPSNLALIRAARATAWFLRFAPRPPGERQPVDVVGHGLLPAIGSRGVVARAQVGLSMRDLYGVNGGRPIDLGSVFAISAPVCRAAPGSACVDAEGRLLGVVFGGLPPRTRLEGGPDGDPRLETTELSFAIPSARVGRIVAELRERGFVTRAYFGVHFRRVSDGMRAHFDLPPSAAAVVAVDETGPAARAGLAANDVILAVDGRSFADLNQLDEALSDRTPGRETPLTVLREGKTLTLSATPAER